jgi:hypothetical protein
LDHDEASLYDQDARGDTPLHAAACNGAVDCVLLLLQYGVDPRTTNKKELKPIDLALRNKQTECREILAEYHLHFCTSSAFDSVLFLATLEGHKQVKHSIGEDGYQIIKVTGGDEDDMSAGSGASHPTEAKKTLRSVQRYGSHFGFGLSFARYTPSCTEPTLQKPDNTSCQPDHSHNRSLSPALTHSACSR